MGAGEGLPVAPPAAAAEAKRCDPPPPVVAVVAAVVVEGSAPAPTTPLLPLLMARDLAKSKVSLL